MTFAAQEAGHPADSRQQAAFKCPKIHGWRRSKNSSAEWLERVGGTGEGLPESCCPTTRSSPQLSSTAQLSSAARLTTREQ